MMKNMTECSRSALMLDGETSKYVDILRGVARGCTLSPNLFKVCVNGMIVAVEAAKQGVTVEEDAVSGLMFADNLWEFYGNTRRIAETNREGTRVL